MGLFDRRKQVPRQAPLPHKKVIDLEEARPAVFALAYAPSLDDGQVRAAITNLARLSGRPTPVQIHALIRNEPDVLQRPWKWLTEVMRQAADSGDHHLAAAGLLWACHWTAILVPRIGRNWDTYMELELDPIDPAIKAEIYAIGSASINQLPKDFVLVGDSSGEMCAGDISEMAESLLDL